MRTETFGSANYQPSSRFIGGGNSPTYLESE
jgi:hypothetical protein